MTRGWYLEFLILHPAQRQGSSVVGRKYRLQHWQNVGEEYFPLFPEPRPLPHSLEGGGEPDRVHPGVRQVLAAKRTLEVRTCGEPQAWNRHLRSTEMLLLDFCACLNEVVLFFLPWVRKDSLSSSRPGGQGSAQSTESTGRPKNDKKRRRRRIWSSGEDSWMRDGPMSSNNTWVTYTVRLLYNSLHLNKQKK